MGNTESNVTSGVKKQAGVSTQALYKFVNLKGGGLLVDMMKRACQTKQFAEIDHAIKTKVNDGGHKKLSSKLVISVIFKVEPFLYNKGAGRYFPSQSSSCFETGIGPVPANCQRFERWRIPMTTSISTTIAPRFPRLSISPIRAPIDSSAGI